MRLRFSSGARTIVKGPFIGENELPSGFRLLRAQSIDEAIEWATRQAAIVGPEGVVAIDVRPVMEPWDVGMTPRPDGLNTRRFMILRKATAATEAGLRRLPDSARRSRRPRERACTSLPKRCVPAEEAGATSIRAMASACSTGRLSKPRS